MCVVHQNERAGGYASGTHDFAQPVNPELGELLKKSHTIQVRLARSDAWLKHYHDVKDKNACSPCLAPLPGKDTRWNLRQDETKRANIIMGDVCETLAGLLDVGGDDYDLLNADEE